MNVTDTDSPYTETPPAMAAPEAETAKT